MRHLVDLNLEAFYPALSLNDDKEFQEFVEASKNKMELRSLDDPNYKMKMELDKDDQRERIARTKLIINEYNKCALSELDMSASGSESSASDKRLLKAR